MEDEVRRVGVVRVAPVAHHEVAVAAVHEHGVEAQQPAIAGCADDAFGYGTVVGRETAIDDFHLGHEALLIQRKVRFAAVVVDGEVAGDAGALREARGWQQHSGDGDSKTE